MNPGIHLVRAHVLFVSMVAASFLVGCTTADKQGWNKTSIPQLIDVVFTAACDGTEQRYVMLLPDRFNSGRPHDILVALHGHGSDRWQFARDPRDECRAARDVGCPLLRSHLGEDNFQPMNGRVK